MIYTVFKGLALRLMKAPTTPPDPPAGAHEHTRVYRASPRFLNYRLLLFYFGTLASWVTVIGLLLLGLAAGERSLVLVSVATMVVGAIVQFCVYFSIRIDYDMRYYVVTDRSIRVREGAFVVKEMTISFANVQNMRAVQGPLLRYFGIKHLQIDTAGGGGASAQGHGTANMHQVRMAGIDNADAVRADIQRHLRDRGATTGLGDPDDHGDVVDKLRGVATGSATIEALRELKDSTASLRGIVTR